MVIKITGARPHAGTLKTYITSIPGVTHFTDEKTKPHKISNMVISQVST